MKTLAASVITRHYKNGVEANSTTAKEDITHAIEREEKTGYNDGGEP